MLKFVTLTTRSHGSEDFLLRNPLYLHFLENIYPLAHLSQGIGSAFDGQFTCRNLSFIFVLCFFLPLLVVIILLFFG